MENHFQDQKINVLIADDHVLLRDALASLINSFDEFKVIGSAGNGFEVISLIENGLRPDLVVLDLNMPELDGFETAIWLHENHPEIRVLVLTMYDSEVALIRLLKVGVRGLLRKNINQHEMRRALVEVAADRPYYSHSTTSQLGTLFRKHQNGHHSMDKVMLNETEISFLKLASTDMTYKEVASQMNLTPRAVDSIRDCLFEKLEVKSRVGLAIYAVRKGIVAV